MSNLNLQKYVPYILVVAGVVVAIKYSFWILLAVAGYVAYNIYKKVKGDN